MICKEIVFIKGWQGYCKGYKITPPAMLRNWLVNNGYAEFVKHEEKTKTPINIKKKGRKKRNG